MIFLYLLVGFFVIVSYGDLPDLREGEDRPFRSGELAAAIVVWCLVVAVWPLAVLCRAAGAARQHVSPTVQPRAGHADTDRSEGHAARN